MQPEPQPEVLADSSQIDSFQFLFSEIWSDVLLHTAQAVECMQQKIHSSAKTHGDSSKQTRKHQKHQIALWYASRLRVTLATLNVFDESGSGDCCTMHKIDLGSYKADRNQSDKRDFSLFCLPKHMGNWNLCQDAAA